MNLYLDDERTPDISYEYTKDKSYIDLEWDIVRSFDEFVNYILENELPELISFDHDLADEHYNYSVEIIKNSMIDYSGFREKTGYECAKWLIGYCIDNNLKLPKFMCHSLNIVGKENIMYLLNNYKKHESS